MTTLDRINKMAEIARDERSDTIKALKLIRAELQRLPDKVPTEAQVIGKLKELRSNAIEVLEIMRLPGNITKDNFDWAMQKAVTEYFLPVEVEYTEEFVISWIEDNIDFSALKNKNQAIGIVKKNLPGVDGTMLKNLIGIRF